MRYRQTMGEGTWDWDGVGWSSYRAILPGGTSVDLNLTEPGFDGEYLHAGQHEWGIYTYDFIVLEFEDGIPEDHREWTEGNADDFQFLKRYRDGYHLWVPENLPPPDDDEPGHDVWTQVPEGGSAELRGYYCLESDWGAKEEQVPRGQDVVIVVVDPELREKSTTSGPGQVGDTGPEYGTEDADEDGKLDGLPLYRFQASDPGGTWRAIFTANDNAGIRSPNWRTHTSVRMITANKVAVDRRAYAIVGRSWPDRGDHKDSLVGHLSDAGYVEILANTEITDASNPEIELTMRKSHYFHFYGHAAHLTDKPCVHWIQIAGKGDEPRNLGYPYGAAWAAPLGRWCGRMRHMHLQGCSTAVPCLAKPWWPSIADYAIEMGAASSAGLRHSPDADMAIPWMDTFYGYANERDEDGKFLRSIWGAVQDAADYIQEHYEDTGGYGRVERQGVMVPSVKYIGDQNIVIAPR